MRDLLVFCPVLRLEPETVTGMFALEWDGPISILLQRDNPTGNPYLDHLHQYQRGREAFLNGRYEGMLVVESDVIVPGDTLRRLVGLVQDGADVAYGVYLFRPRQKEQETGLPRFARNDTLISHREGRSGVPIRDCRASLAMTTPVSLRGAKRRSNLIWARPAASQDALASGGRIDGGVDQQAHQSSCASCT